MSWETLRARLPRNYTPLEVAFVQRAYERAAAAHGDQLRKSGEPYIIHPEEVAGILADLRFDVDTLAAALLHDVAEDTVVPMATLASEFGQQVGILVDGVTKLKNVRNRLPDDNLVLDASDPQTESLRKMYLATGKDVRVILIKLADRLHNMRTLVHVDEEAQKRISRETLDIYAPLADRLGIYQIKWELEDLAFHFLEPEKYREIERALVKRRDERQAIVKHLCETLRTELLKHNIQATVKGRPKHIYSIYRKMVRKGITQVQDIYDREGVRVMVPEVADCYVALGVVHNLWRPVRGEFDDYIANPKDNQYRSLHTAVIHTDRQSFEVQIRTPEMDRVAEMGIAAHWRYKSQTQPDLLYDQKIASLRAFFEQPVQENANGSEFMAAVREDLFQDRVYILTPKGEIVDLPAGATPVDFAYQIHSEIGHRCRGAKVNGKLVGLDYQLKNGEQVEILTVKRGGPSRDWLNTHLGYVKTTRARHKIRQWFRQQDRDANIAAGREALQHQLEQLSVNLTFERVTELFGRGSVDALLEDIGSGEITIADIADKVLELTRVVELPKSVSESLGAQEAPQKPAISGDGITVQGARNMLTTIGRCCGPMRGDEIIGFVTRGSGVTVHRKDCPNVLSLDPISKEQRLIEVYWGQVPKATARVKIRVHAYDRAGLLRDITEIFDKENISMEYASAVTARQDNLALITATLEVRDAEQVGRIFAKIERVPNVIEVRRQVG
ncbi:MAG: pyrophosphokinae [Chloroflexota bacterium]|nr:pyrophosphokinae [Chloroflexota bacterium]